MRSRSFPRAVQNPYQRVGTGIKILLIVLPLLFCLPISSWTQESKDLGSRPASESKSTGSIQPEAAELFNKVSRTYKDLKEFEYELVIKSSMNSGETSKNSQTLFSVAAHRPDKIKMILRNAAGEIQYFRNGETTTTYLPRLRQYLRKPIENTNGSKADEPEPGPFDFASAVNEVLSQFETIGEGVDRARIVGEEALLLEGQPNDCFVLEIEIANPLEGAKATIKRTYWIGKTRFLVLKSVSESHFVPSSGENVVHVRTEKTFSSFKTEGPIPDANFNFSPPPGTSEVSEFIEPPRHAEGLVGGEAPDFTLKTVKGESFQLKRLRGKVVLLSFWATWCGPCRMEMPVLDKLSQQYHSKGLLIFGINDEDRETIQDYLQENGYRFPTLIDESQEVAILYRIRAIPTMVVIDREGKLVSYHQGLSQESEIKSALKMAGIE
ncbi:MAG: redoxin domain-containing protein [Terriglobia bacterium]